LKNKNNMIKKEVKKEQYFEATGGRKTARARARLFNKKGELMINGRPYMEYFQSLKNQIAARGPLEHANLLGNLSVSVKVAGGGLNAQAEAVANAVAKALTQFNPSLKKAMRKAGFMTRDARMVERKKYGLKKARRAPQWAKR